MLLVGFDIDFCHCFGTQIYCLKHKYILYIFTVCNLLFDKVNMYFTKV